MSEAIRASLRATSKLYVDMSEVLAEPAARAAELLIAALMDRIRGTASDAPAASRKGNRS